MKMRDFTFCYKKVWHSDGLWPAFKWDLFLSAFNSSDRVRGVFEKVNATKKLWFISPGYGYSEAEIPKDAECFCPSDDDEAIAIADYHYCPVKLSD
jgi:hypothetical protein